MTWKQCVGKTELRHPLAIDLTASRIAQEGKLLADRAKNSSPISLKKILCIQNMMLYCWTEVLIVNTLILT